jgi:hypothetical protein
VISQDDWYHYDWAAPLPHDYNDLYEKALNYNLKRYKENMYIGKFYERASADLALNIQEDINAGNFYGPINGSDEYLKKMLENLIKDTAVSNHVRIIIYRDHEWGASMNESGLIRLNIRTLASLNNEAELAMLIGHEVGHFMNEDVIKSYGRQIDADGITGTSPWHLLTSYFNYYWHSREEESAADFAAIKFIKNSSYSLKAAGNLFRMIKRIEVRADIKNGRLFNAFKTHPDPGTRMKQIKYFSNDSINEGKKKFVVDSLAFVKLKEKCFQETLNLLLQQSQADEVIDLTFVRYLMEPGDLNNLAVLIEGIRRKLYLGQRDNIQEKPFILSQYQTENIKTSENYGYLNRSNISILNYLTKGFIEITKEDLPNIKARDLADTTVTEFSTYFEAFVYFKNKAAQNNCKACDHYKYFNSITDTSGISPLNGTDIFETKDLLIDKRKIPPSGKDMFVVVPVEAVKKSYILNRTSDAEQKELNKKIIEALSSSLGQRPVYPKDLPLTDQHLMQGVLTLAYNETTPGTDEIAKHSDLNWLYSSPELYSFFKRNNINNLYICIPALRQIRRQTEISNFIKVSIPSLMSHSISTKRIHKDLTTHDKDYEAYIKRLSDQYQSFYSLNKN